MLTIDLLSVICQRPLTLTLFALTCLYCLGKGVCQVTYGVWVILWGRAPSKCFLLSPKNRIFRHTTVKSVPCLTIEAVLIGQFCNFICNFMIVETTEPGHCQKWPSSHVSTCNILPTHGLLPLIRTKCDRFRVESSCSKAAPVK